MMWSKHMGRAWQIGRQIHTKTGMQTDCNCKYKELEVHNDSAREVTPFSGWTCQSSHGQLSPYYPHPCPSLNLFPLPLSCPRCRQTINQCFVGWMAHSHCSCRAQQKGRINKVWANHPNGQPHGWTDIWIDCYDCYALVTTYCFLLIIRPTFYEQMIEKVNVTMSHSYSCCR